WTAGWASPSARSRRSTSATAGWPPAPPPATAPATAGCPTPSTPSPCSAPPARRSRASSPARPARTASRRWAWAAPPARRTATPSPPCCGSRRSWRRCRRSWARARTSWSGAPARREDPQHLEDIQHHPQLHRRLQRGVLRRHAPAAPRGDAHAGRAEEVAQLRGLVHVQDQRGVGRFQPERRDADLPRHLLLLAPGGGDEVQLVQEVEALRARELDLDLE